jgi:hypothetical protein
MPRAARKSGRALCGIEQANSDPAPAALGLRLQPCDRGCSAPREETKSWPRLDPRESHVVAIRSGPEESAPDCGREVTGETLRRVLPSTGKDRSVAGQARIPGRYRSSCRLLTSRRSE